MGQQNLLNLDEALRIIMALNTAHHVAASHDGQEAEHRLMFDLELQDFIKQQGLDVEKFSKALMAEIERVVN